MNFALQGFQSSFHPFKLMTLMVKYLPLVTDLAPEISHTQK